MKNKLSLILFLGKVFKNSTFFNDPSIKDKILIKCASNLEMLYFTAIINPPQSAILAVGAGQKIPIVNDDKIVICNVMNVTLSCDHRAIDGAVGAKFLQVFKKIIENPMLMSL